MASQDRYSRCNLYAKRIGKRQSSWYKQSLLFAPVRRFLGGLSTKLFAAGGCESGLLDYHLSLPYLTAAWKIKCRSAAAKIVLVSLADNYNSKTGLCCPSITTIAKRCDLSRQGVLNIILQLEKDGILKVKRLPRKGNRYWFGFAPEAGQPGLPTGQRCLPALVNVVDSNRNRTVNNRGSNKWLSGKAPKSTAPKEVTDSMLAALKATVT